MRNAATPCILLQNTHATLNFLPCTVADRGNARWRYGYTATNQIAHETLTIDGRVLTTTYDYDTDDHLKYRRYPGSPCANGACDLVSYEPDAFGRASKVTMGGVDYMRDVKWHSNNTLEEATYGNSQVMTRTLNDRQLVQRIRSGSFGRIPIKKSYRYDARGLITDIDDDHNSSRDQRFDYNGLGRLLSGMGPWGNSGNQVSANYAYDALGNLKRKQLGGRVVTAQYNWQNRVASVTDNRTLTPVTASYSYDARGNVTNNGRTSFVYDRSEQPVAVDGNRYVYDAHFRRVKQTIDGETFYSVYTQSGSLLHRLNANTGVGTDYLTLGGASVRLINGANPLYTHKDHLGSPLGATDSAGNVLWWDVYTPFGERVNGLGGDSSTNSAINDNNEGFTGHIEDTALRLNYMQARYQDPAIGRFLSNDPVSFLDSGLVKVCRG